METMNITQLKVLCGFGVSYFFAAVTFGRDTAQFEQLIEFLAWLSIALWAIVGATTLWRTHSHYRHAWNKRKARKNIERSTHGSA
jgi:IS1 family transposase